MVIALRRFSFSHDLTRKNDSQRTGQVAGESHEYDILQSQKIANKAAHQHGSRHAPEDRQADRAVLLLSEIEGLSDFLHHVAMQAEGKSRGHQGDATANEQPARINHAISCFLNLSPRMLVNIGMPRFKLLESVGES